MDDQHAVITVTPRALMPVMDIEQAVARRDQLVQYVKQIMVEGTDYGKIPGTGDKNVLLKPGAEKLTTFFGLTVRFETQEKVEDWTGRDHGDEPFFYYRFSCQLYQGDRLIVEADGSCSSFESKYRYRRDQRACPSCGENAIIKGREDWGGGWVCWNKRGGCGAKFKDGDQSIESQAVGRVANPDVADQVNTVLKMAQKRALIAATLLGVNASEFFTQDLEDFEPGTGPAPETKQEPAARKQTGQTDQQKRDDAPPADSKRRSKKAANGNGKARRSAIDWDAFLPVLSGMYDLTEDEVKAKLGNLDQYASSADAKAAMDAPAAEETEPEEAPGRSWKQFVDAAAEHYGLTTDTIWAQLGMMDQYENEAQATAVLEAFINKSLREEEEQRKAAEQQAML